MFFIAYTFKGQVHVFCRMSENCKSIVLQDKCNIEIVLSPGPVEPLNISAWVFEGLRIFSEQLKKFLYELQKLQVSCKHY